VSLDTGGSGAPIYLPLRFGTGQRSTLTQFLGIEFKTEFSELSAANRIIYTGVPFQRAVPFFDEITILDSVRVPSAYLVPPEWIFVPEILAVHGIRSERTTGVETLSVESYTFADVKFGSRPYEGRQNCTYKATLISEKRTFPPGTIVVRTNQRARNVAVHLFEPGSGDSFVSWGFFSAIFEQKEYGEGYIIERVARDMAKANPALTREFQAKVNADSTFARSAAARLNWWYQRSPYADQWLNKYPIARLVGEFEGKTKKVE
jgi:hypothetical protein